MRLTYRLVLLVAVGAIPLLFIHFAPWLLTAVVLYNILLGALTIADFLAAPVPERVLTVDRYVDDKLSLGASNPVTVRGTQRLRPAPQGDVPRRPALPVRPRGADAADADAPSRQPARAILVSPHPAAKGDFFFGDIYVQYEGRLGLVARLGRLPARRPIKVYPNLIETEKYELLARRGRLQQLGIRAARIRGGGSVFESLREYVPGDEYKKIDWNATAGATSSSRASTKSSAARTSCSCWTRAAPCSSPCKRWQSWITSSTPP